MVEFAALTWFIFNSILSDKRTFRIKPVVTGRVSRAQGRHTVQSFVPVCSTYQPILFELQISAEPVHGHRAENIVYKYHHRRFQQQQQQGDPVASWQREFSRSSCGGDLSQLVAKRSDTQRRPLSRGRCRLPRRRLPHVEHDCRHVPDTARLHVHRPYVLRVGRPRTSTAPQL